MKSARLRFALLTKPDISMSSASSLGPGKRLPGTPGSQVVFWALARTPSYHRRYASPLKVNYLYEKTFQSSGAANGVLFLVAVRELEFIKWNWNLLSEKKQKKDSPAKIFFQHQRIRSEPTHWSPLDSLDACFLENGKLFEIFPQTQRAPRSFQKRH